MARTGKIARLPKDLRDAVNLALNDGAGAAFVIDMITKAKANGAKNGDGGEIEIPNDQNVTNWRDGGYKEWLGERQRLEDMRFKRELALEIVRQNEGSKLQEATLHLASSQLYEVLTEFDLGPLKQLLSDKPENYAAIVNSLAKLSKGALDVERFKENVKARREAIERELGVARDKGGITAETMERIERELKLL